ncbi:hypothetical protein [Thalassobius sp. I31.1]|uniref:hypothetical protein n=1 Tax=Thalassobius sp. I31.1 TaxID=2109912 RepID=UPI000D19AD3E|nr:hypothetical protein [Thalassobius sp. I31.1]
MRPSCKIYQFPGGTPFRPGAGIMAGGAYPQFTPGHINSDAAQGARCCPTTINKRAPIRSPQRHLNAAEAYRNSLRYCLRSASLLALGFLTVVGIGLLTPYG